MVLFTNWGEFFWPLYKDKKLHKKVMLKIKKSCPIWYGLFTEHGRISYFSFANDFTGLLLPIELDEDIDVTFIGNKNVWIAAEELKDFSLQLYNEIKECCMLSTWVDRLP